VTIPDYLADCPDWYALAGNGAGTGPLADEVYRRGEQAEFRNLANKAVHALVVDGMPVDDAIGAYNPEQIAAAVLTA
jgi:hypothetical protein